MQTAQPIEEVISLVAARRRISIDDIEQTFNLPNRSTRNIIDFLLKFDFIRKVEGKYLVLSESCMPFFDDNVSRE